jgi:hypothetical protein
VLAEPTSESAYASASCVCFSGSTSAIPPDSRSDPIAHRRSSAELGYRRKVALIARYADTIGGSPTCRDRYESFSARCNRPRDWPGRGSSQLSNGAIP